MSADDAHDPATDPSIHDRPAELLQSLILFDTTNPPGNERACVEYIEGLFSTTGLETETYAKDPERPNLVARLPGRDEAPALLFQGHVDVVPTTGQEWTKPPFEGVTEDGFVWGRGALDMKSAVTMMIASVLRAAEAGVEPAGDIVVLILADEEAGGEYGASFMVEEHPEVFSDVEHAIGEFGGFSLDLAGQRFYPIQMNEKQICWMKATFRGPAGHGSTARSGGAMADMARTVTAIDEARLPVHVTPTAERMIEAIAAELSSAMADQFRGLLDPERTDAILDQLGDAGEMLDAILHNTANPTVVRGGDKENVIPATVEFTLDCRLLPGQTIEDVQRELRAVVPDDVGVEFEPIQYEPFPAEADGELFDLLAGVLSDADSGGTPIPLLLPAVTDARHLARAGVQTYGFTPMSLPADFAFLDLIHAADERVPVEAVEFGTDAMFEVINRYQG